MSPLDLLAEQAKFLLRAKFPPDTCWALPRTADDIFILCGHWTLNIAFEPRRNAQGTLTGFLWTHPEAERLKAVWN